MVTLFTVTGILASALMALLTRAHGIRTHPFKINAGNFQLKFQSLFRQFERAFASTPVLKVFLFLPSKPEVWKNGFEYVINGWYVSNCGLHIFKK